MKKKEVIIGKIIAWIVFLAALCLRMLVADLPYIYAHSMIFFSVLLFTLCVIGDRKRKKQEDESASKDKQI
jgi:membrane protein implicated in regulation of membrane protease activity